MQNTLGIIFRIFLVPALGRCRVPRYMHAQRFELWRVPSWEKKRRSFEFSYLKKSLKHLYHSFNTSENLRRHLGRTFGPPPPLRDSPGSRRTSLPPIRELNNISGLCWIDLIIKFFFRTRFSRLWGPSRTAPGTLRPWGLPSPSPLEGGYILRGFWPKWPGWELPSSTSRWWGTQVPRRESKQLKCFDKIDDSREVTFYKCFSTKN